MKPSISSASESWLNDTCFGWVSWWFWVIHWRKCDSHCSSLPLSLTLSQPCLYCIPIAFHVYLRKRKIHTQWASVFLLTSQTPARARNKQPEWHPGTQPRSLIRVAGIHPLLPGRDHISSELWARAWIWKWIHNATMECSCLNFNVDCSSTAWLFTRVCNLNYYLAAWNIIISSNLV